MAAVSGLLDAIPGYRGYRAKEDRRDADRRVREKVAADLTASAARVERVGLDLANARRIREVGPVNDVGQRIRHLIDRVATASYGYGGLFSDRDIDEAALDQLRAFDEGMLDSASELDAPVAALEDAAKAGGDTAAAARDGMRVVDRLLARFDLRGEVIQTGRVQPQETVDSVLSPKPAAETEPPPAFNLHEGDAVAVLGDNFVVDSRIDFTGADRAVRLFRVDVVPDRWLLVDRTPGESHALLEQTNQTYAPGAESTIGETAYIVNWSASGTGDAIGRGGESGSRAATVTMLRGAEDPALRAAVIDWGNERQVLTGKEIHPDDVEIFGATRM